MILSDRDIKSALDQGVIKIDPDPRHSAWLWSSTAVDLRLDRELSFWPAGGVPGGLRPADPNYSYHTVTSQHQRAELIPQDGFALPSGGFCLGWTIEKLQLPHLSQIAARVEGKSSLARVGLGVHVTAPTIHAGFGSRPNDPSYPGSPIQLEIWNVEPSEIVLDFQMPVCQLIFELVEGAPENAYSGRFSVQGPRPTG